eukprot:5280765-Pyramimonas_sp.AAC.1
MVPGSGFQADFGGRLGSQVPGIPVAGFPAVYARRPVRWATGFFFSRFPISGSLPCQVLGFGMSWLWPREWVFDRKEYRGQRVASRVDQREWREREENPIAASVRYNVEKCIGRPELEGI